MSAQMLKTGAVLLGIMLAFSQCGVADDSDTKRDEAAIRALVAKINEA